MSSPLTGFSPKSPAHEVGVVVARLAAKLRCDTVILVGCLRPALLEVTADGPFAVTGFDTSEWVQRAHVEFPRGTWAPDAAGLPATGSRPLVVASFTGLQALEPGRLDALLAAAPALLLLDADGALPIGPAGLAEARARAAGLGLTVVRGELVTAIEGGPRSSPLLVVAGTEGDVGALVAGGVLGLLLDPALDGARASPNARVCVVSNEVVGPSRNGGIGTANTSLALGLARHGLRVSLLYSGAPRDADEHAHWVGWFAERDVRYDQISGAATDRVVNAFENVRSAWAVYEHLLAWQEEEPFDVIHGPEYGGHLAFAALARRQGIAFDAAEIVCGTHSPTRWTYEANRASLDSLAALASEFLERAAVRNADVVISPSAYMLAYLRDRGWELPERAFVQPYLGSDAVRDLLDAGRPEPQAADELVFFGRLESRKGLEPFCDALDLLARDDGLRPRAVTFLGSSVQRGDTFSADDVRARARAWPWETQLLTDHSQPDAVAYLRAGRRVAVVPSLVDNSPNTVYETLALGVPVVIGGDGGTGELVAPEDRDRHTFSFQPVNGPLAPAPAGHPVPAPDPRGLASALRDTLHAAAPPPRFAVDPAVNERAHVVWNAATRRLPAPTPASTSLSFVTFAPTAETVRALAATSDGVVVGTPAAGLELPAGWWAIDPAAGVDALNEAVGRTGGDLVVVLPAGITPQAGLASVVGRAASRSGAALFTLVARSSGNGPPEQIDVPAGGPPVVGLSHPVEGENGYGVRRAVLREEHGFEPGPDPAANLLTRCSVAGRRIETVPSVLVERDAPSSASGLGFGGRWPESVAWPREPVARLAPFVSAPVAVLSQLPALYRTLQEVLVRVRADADEGRRHADRVETQVEVEAIRHAGEEARLRAEGDQLRDELQRARRGLLARARRRLGRIR